MKTKNAKPAAKQTAAKPVAAPIHDPAWHAEQWNPTGNPKHVKTALQLQHEARLAAVR